MNSALHEDLSRTAGALSQLLLLTGRQLLQVKRIEGEVQEFGCNSIKHYASCTKGIRGFDAARLVHVAEKLEQLPHLTREVEAGRLSWYQVEVMVDYATPETDEACVGLARDSNVDDLRRWVRNYGASLNPDKTTEVVVNWSLDVATSIIFDHAQRKLSEEAGRRLRHKETIQRMSALVLAGSYDEKTLAKLQNEVKLDFLAAQSQAAMSLEQLPDTAPVGEPQVRLELIAAIPATAKPRYRMNPFSRSLTPKQKREMHRREGYCCATPGCEHTLFLDVHHVVFWYEGGLTVPQNLVVLCRTCHRLIHEGYLILVGVAPYGLIFRDRHGHELNKFAPFLKDDELIRRFLEQVDSAWPDEPDEDRETS